jgi:hypothetical protein
LCALALSASAQCVAEAHTQAVPHDKGSGWIVTASAGTVDTEPGRNSRDALMNVAAADTTGIRPATPRAAAQKQDAAPGQEHRRRTGTAMLIAAVAVMSAIALRRLGAADL